MSDADAQRWNTRYADGAYATREHPTTLLADSLAELPRGRALDVACGAGRNACFLAANGWQVDAIDVSEVALARGAARALAQSLQINWRCEDLDDVRLESGAYALIVVARFLDRRLFPALADALAPGGCLLYETHMLTQRSDVGGPGSFRFRLRPGELLHLVHPLRILHYHEGLVRDPDGPLMALAQTIACRGVPHWEQQVGDDR